MNFPVYIGGINTEAVKPAMVDLSPLANSFMTNAKKRASTAKTPKETKYDIDATIGEGLAFDAEIAKNQSVINEQIKLYGADNLAFVNSLPEVQKAYSNIENMATPGRMNAMKQNKSIVGDYRTYIKDSGEQYDLENMKRGKGLRSYGDRLTQMENSGSTQSTIKGMNLKHSTMGAEGAWDELDKQLSVNSWAKTEVSRNAKTHSSVIVDQIKGVWGKGIKKSGRTTKSTTDNVDQRDAKKSALTFGGDILHGLEQGFVTHIRSNGDINKIGGKDGLFDKDLKPTDKYYDELGKYVNQKIKGIYNGQEINITKYDSPNTGITSFTELSDDALGLKRQESNMEALFSNKNHFVGADFGQPTNLWDEAMATFQTDKNLLLDAIKEAAPSREGAIRYASGKGIVALMQQMSRNPKESKAMDAALRKRNLMSFSKAFTQDDDAKDLAVFNVSGNTKRLTASGNKALDGIMGEVLNLPLGERRAVKRLPEGMNFAGDWRSGTNLPDGTTITYTGGGLLDVTGPKYNKNNVLQEGSLATNKEAQLDVQRRKQLAQEIKNNPNILDEDKQMGLIYSSSINAAQGELRFPTVEKFYDYVSKNEFYMPKEYDYKDKDYALVDEKGTEFKRKLNELNLKKVAISSSKAGAKYGYNINGNLVDEDEGIKQIKGIILDERNGTITSSGDQKAFIKKGRLDMSSTIEIPGGKIKGGKNLTTSMKGIRLESYVDKATGEIRQEVVLPTLINIQSAFSNKNLAEKALQSELGAETKNNKDNLLIISN